MRIAVVGAGIGGLAAAVRLSAAGHHVTVLEAAAAPGGKAGRYERDGFRFDTGPSLLTMPRVLEALFGQTGPPLAAEVDLVRVEPVTTYRFADGTSVALSADLAATTAALEAWSAGAGEDWAAFLGACAGMWRAAEPVLSGPPPWPPRRPGPGERPPDPRDLLRVRPWATVRSFARARIRDPRLRLVVERFATYAGADPRRAPAALALAGYVEHAYGAWHVRGGLHEIAEALVRRLESLGGELRLQSPVAEVEVAGAASQGTGVGPTGRRVRRRVTGVRLADGGRVAADAVVWNGDALALATRALPGAAPRRPEPTGRSLSGFALMLGLRDRTPGLGHHTILFPADYDAEFDDVFGARRPARDPTLYVSVSAATAPEEAPAGCENWFVLVNAPLHGPVDWDAEADAYESAILARLAARGLDPAGRIVVRARRTPADLERDTGAIGGAIYGAAPHGRLGTLRRPGNRWPGIDGLWLVGGTAHPGGGLPLVMLSGAIVAAQIGPA